RGTGSSDDLPFRSRIEPGSAGLVDVEITEIAMAGHVRGNHAHHVADDNDSVVLIPNFAQKAQGRGDGAKTTGRNVAAQRAAYIPPALGGQARARPNNWTDARVGVAGAYHGIGLNINGLGHPRDDGGRNPVFAVSVRDEQI